MNKLYITRDSVLSYLRSGGWGIDSLQRSVNIEKVFSAEARVMDGWCSRFFADLNPPERQLRQAMREAGSVFFREEDLHGLVSMSEALVSLHVGPVMADYILVTRRLLGAGGTRHFDMGELKLRNICVDLIVDHFER